MSFDIDRISARVDGLRAKHLLRDGRMRDVRAVRRGDFDAVAPDLFSDEWPRPIVANMIDSSAQAAAGALSTLPAISCRTAKGNSDRARDYADKRSRIANNYLHYSDVAGQMYTAADQFFSYGLMVAVVEPDFETGMPRITYEDSSGVYPVWDRAGRTIEVARLFTRTLMELIAEYPEHERKLTASVRHAAPSPTTKIEVVKFVDKSHIVLYVPSASNLILEYTPNVLGECYYECTRKPGLDDEIRGSYDDLIWVQLARHSLQVYALEAAQKAVQAPIVVPNDVGDVPMGPDAIIRTQGGRQSVGRVDIQIPAGTFGAIDHLKDEINQSAVVPPSPGSIDSSIITGVAVREIYGGYSQQIATSQEALKGHFRRIIGLCFRMDEKLWPEQRKSIRSVAEGVPYDELYAPAKDIRKDHSVEVTYGFAAGLDANRALVMLLQAQGAGLVSRDFTRRGLPGGVNASEEETKIATESMRDSLLQMLSALSQSVPALVAQGQDPTQIVQMVAEVTDEVQKGKPLESVVRKIFAPPPPPEPTAPAEGEVDPATGQPVAGAEGAGASGFGPDGLPSGLTANEVTGGQNERPDLQMLFAGLTSSGNPNLSAGVSRYTPAAG